MKGGAEAQLSIHTPPAASPVRRGRGTNTSTRESSQRSLWDPINTQITRNDLGRTEPACSSALSCHTQPGLLEIWLFALAS